MPLPWLLPLLLALLVAAAVPAAGSMVDAVVFAAAVVAISTASVGPVMLLWLLLFRFSMFLPLLL